jgi:hypothetical protein
MRQKWTHTRIFAGHFASSSFGRSFMQHYDFGRPIVGVLVQLGCVDIVDSQTA